MVSTVDALPQPSVCEPWFDQMTAPYYKSDTIQVQKSDKAYSLPNDLQIQEWRR